MHKINYTSIITQDIDDVNFIYTIYRLFFSYMQYTVLHITFYDKLYGLSQKILTCMPNLSV